MNADRPGRHTRLPWGSQSGASGKDAETLVSHRVPVFDRLSPTVKHHFIAMMGEFVGTFLFLLFAFGGTNAVNSIPGQGSPAAVDPAKLLYISLCFGMSLAVNAVCSFALSPQSRAPLLAVPPRE